MKRTFTNFDARVLAIVEATESGTSAELRKVNVQRVLKVIRDRGPISRRELGELVGLSKPTVISVIEDLLRVDLVLESNEGMAASKSTRGPAPRLVRFNANHALVAGVDVGAAKILVLLSNLDGEVLAKARCRTSPDATGRWLDQTIKVLIDNCLEQAGVGRGRLAIVTVGTTGVVDRESGSVEFAPQLPGWQGRAVRTALEKSLGLPVLIENEAHLAMLGEYWRGVAVGATEAAFVQMGIGVGMGILIGGEIYRGAVGAAGEIGYLPIGDAQPGQGPGAFETAVGSKAFSRGLLRSDSPAIEPDQISSNAEEDEGAKSAIQTILGHLAAGLASISVILNPELIVLGGGLSSYLAPYVAELQESLKDHIPSPPRIELSALADSAVAVGAIKRGISFIEDRLFDLGLGPTSTTKNMIPS